MKKELTQRSISEVLFSMLEGNPSLFLKDYKMYLTANPFDVKDLSNEVVAILKAPEDLKIKTLNVDMFSLHIIRSTDVEEGEWFVSTGIVNNN